VQSATGSSDVLTASAASGSVTPTRRPSGQSLADRPPRSGFLGTAFVVTAYLSIGFVAFWPIYPGISQRLFSSQLDYTQTIWFLDWVPYALTHGHNPFFSNAIFVPTGVNLAQNTSTPLLAWISAPFAPFLSPVVRANLLMVLAMPISATAAFVVLRKWRVWGPAAALGGLIYGFSPYMVGQSTAHLNLLFVPLPPFIALTVASILNRGSSRRLGVQLGLLVAAQYLICPEVLATVAILTVVAVAYVGIRRRANLERMVHGASRAIGIAVVVSCVLLAYPVWMALFGPQHFTGPPHAIPSPGHADLLSFVVPTSQQRFSLGLQSLGKGLPILPEAGGYIGIPLLVLTGALAWRSRRRPRTQVAVVLMISAALLSLGSYLAIDGHLTGIPLPFLVVDHLPVLDAIVPSRISFEVDACLAAVIAFGLDDMRREPKGSWMRWPGSAVVATVTLAVLVITQLPQWPETNTSQQVLALPAALTRAFPSGDPVALTYPYDLDDSYLPGLNGPMLWQAEEGFGFQLLGGYADHVAPGGGISAMPSVMHPSGTQAFLANEEGDGDYGPRMPVSPRLVAVTRFTVALYHVRLVIVDRALAKSGAAMELFSDALGPPKVSAGPFSMWADWRGVPSREQFSHGLSTKVVLPANNATISGKATLETVVKAYYELSKFQYFLTGEDHHSTLIAEGVPTPFGPIVRWNTTNVANGTYSLQCVVYDEFGASTRSAAITITINNRRQLAHRKKGATQSVTSNRSRT
jgi:hypothetical protein